MHKTSIVLPSESGSIYCNESIGIGMIDKSVMVIMVVWYVLLVHTYNIDCMVGGGTYFWYINLIEVMTLVHGHPHS